jgi:hypothetical protein
MRTVDERVPPLVSVVIPVRNSMKVGATVKSLLDQDYAGEIEVILVGGEKDDTWNVVEEYADDERLRCLEVHHRTRLRDSNIKRQTGLLQARGEIIAMTDGDMIPPRDWVSSAVAELQAGWDCVGGSEAMLEDSVWARYVDRNRVAPKTPRLDGPYNLDHENFGARGRKPPITANVFVTRNFYERVGGPNPAMQRSYEDYEWFWRGTADGLRCRMIPTLLCSHDHRKNFKHLICEYFRSGLGCSDFINKHPGSVFAKQRLHQLTLASDAVLTSMSVALITFLSGHVLVLVPCMACVYMCVLAFESRGAPWPDVLAYPLLTAAFGLLFAAGLSAGLTFMKAKSTTVASGEYVLFAPGAASGREAVGDGSTAVAVSIALGQLRG